MKPMALGVERFVAAASTFALVPSAPVSQRDERWPESGPASQRDARLHMSYVDEGVAPPSEAPLSPPPSPSALPSSSAPAPAPASAPASASATERSLDRALVDRAKNGDARAFGELVRRHQQRIHRLALHMLRDRADADDVVQETFVRAYQALARFDGRSEPYTWLYRIAINLSLNVIRARKPQRRGGDPSDPRLEALMSHNMTKRRPSAMADPPGDAARRQLYAAMCEGIDKLSDTLRTTLIVVCIDGRSHEDAAQILGAPEGTIAWRVHEARKKLKSYLQDRGFDPEGEGP